MSDAPHVTLRGEDGSECLIEWAAEMDVDMYQLIGGPGDGTDVFMLTINGKPYAMTFDMALLIAKTVRRIKKAMDNHE